MKIVDARFTGQAGFPSVSAYCVCPRETPSRYDGCECVGKGRTVSTEEAPATHDHAHIPIAHCHTVLSIGHQHHFVSERFEHGFEVDLLDRNGAPPAGISVFKAKGCGGSIQREDGSMPPAGP